MSKFRPIVSSRISPEKLGIEVDNSEYRELQDSAERNEGVANLAEVYHVPAASNGTKEQETVNKFMEREGLEYGEEQYKKEYQLKAAHQVMINGGTTASLAQMLNISLPEARKLKRELAARQIAEIKKLDVTGEVAKAYMFYDSIAAKALQLSNKGDINGKGGGTVMRNQIEALKVALQAQTDKQKFLVLAGAYEQGLRPGSASDRHLDGANETRDMLNAVLSGDTFEVVDIEDDFNDDIEIL